MQVPFPPVSLYVHLPWCVRKCPYCDFNSHRAGDAASFDRYVEALLADIRQESEKVGDRRIESIFLGGGTPSLFSPAQIERILARCRDDFRLGADCEVTMEVNPGTVEHGSLGEYRGAGVNRLSIGAQSFDAGTLKTLGRIHGPGEILSTCEEARQAGFDNFNIDLMFALPGQDVAGAEADIREAVALGPTHISWYQLTLEPNTVFHRHPPPGIPTDDLAWSIQEAGRALLRDAGYEQYEISAYSKPGYQCRHNLNYWQFGDYLAAGAGAHGKLTDGDGGICRYRKAANPAQFMEQAERGEPALPATPVGHADLDFEFMLNALRLTRGFSSALYRERTGHEIGMLGEDLDRAVADGLLEEFLPGEWRPTDDGFRFLNDLQARFLPSAAP